MPREASGAHSAGPVLASHGEILQLKHSVDFSFEISRTAS